MRLKRKAQPAGAIGHWLVALPLALTGASAVAQDTGSSLGAGGLAVDTSPYYLGASQTFTHESNAYRVPFGASDTYSTTTLLAGFDQPISRQRFFGTASVGVNRYFNESQLNNTSYDLATGVDWSTIWRLAGNVTATLDQRLVAPTATVAAPVSTRNLEKRQSISGLARWGGDAAISLEGRLGYSAVDYSAPAYVASESNNETGSFGVFYRPGSQTRVGLAVRVDRTRTPQAIRLDDGSYQSNETRGRNLDLLGEYNNGSNINASGRLSLTRQRNSNVDSADFSGLTGGVNLGYRATGKLAFSLAASRDAGFNSTNGTYVRTAAVPSGGVSTAPTTIGSARSLYENNQVTNSVSAGVSYAATSKIGVGLNARYSRARLITSAAASTSASQARPDVVDKTRGASLTANYAFSRVWSFACSLASDRREVAGAYGYGYTDNVASCSAQFLWR